MKRNLCRVAVLAAALITPFSVQAGGGLAEASPPGVVYDWSGLYVGGHVGKTWMDLSSEFDSFYLSGLGDGVSHELDGWLAGGHIGLQHQVGRLVLGIEGSLSGGDLSDSTTGSYSYNAVTGSPPLAFGIFGAGDERFTAELNNVLSLTGRLGYVWDRFLIYAKGGVASAKISTRSDLQGEVGVCFFDCESADYRISGQTNQRHIGWTLGAGLEYMIRPDVIVGVEYSYLDLGAKTHRGTADGEFSDFGPDYAMRVDPDPLHSVSARLSFKLGRDSAPAALK